jgi:hypothetical protein
VVAAHRNDRAPAPRADGSGHDGDGVEVRVRPPIQVLAGDVLDGLPARQDVDPVAHLHVPGHGAHLRVLEVPHDEGDALGRDLRVGVEAHQDLTSRGLDGAVQGRRLARVRLEEESHARLAAELARDHLAGAVR